MQFSKAGPVGVDFENASVVILAARETGAVETIPDKNHFPLYHRTVRDGKNIGVAAAIGIDAEKDPVEIRAAADRSAVKRVAVPDEIGPRIGAVMVQGVETVENVVDLRRSCECLPRERSEQN